MGSYLYSGVRASFAPYLLFLFCFFPSALCLSWYIMEQNDIHIEPTDIFSKHLLSIHGVLFGALHEREIQLQHSRFMTGLQHAIGCGAKSNEIQHLLSNLAINPRILHRYSWYSVHIQRKLYLSYFIGLFSNIAEFPRYRLRHWSLSVFRTPSTRAARTRNLFNFLPTSFFFLLLTLTN